MNPQPDEVPNDFDDPSGCRPELIRVLDVLRLTDLLLIAPDPTRLLSDDDLRPDRPRIEARDPDAVMEGRLEPRRYETAIVADTLEHMSKARGAALIARLRDVYAQRLLVLIAREEATSQDTRGWRRTDFNALGLSPIKTGSDPGRRWAVFQFDLFNYKTTPDWLNSKHWANPEMWDKARW